jgi:UDP-N-acetylmuramoyl-L-alanyl-D-glutamate--2,6-diaminopimelate ligase
MELTELIGRLDPRAVHGPLDVVVRAVTRDSRQAGVGVVFVAIRGERVDGHELVAGLPAGSVAVVGRPVAAPEGVTVLEVADTGNALARVAAALAGDPARVVRVVGVTGTNGKTTVTTLCAAAMGALGRAAGRIGTLGAAWPGVARPAALTTPEATELQGWLAEMRDVGVQAAFVEVSSAALPRGRADALPFHTVVFTNLGRDHLDLHGDMESYAAAKALLFHEDRLRPAGGPPRAIGFGDDPWWPAMQPPSDRWTYGFGPTNDLRIVDLALAGAGQRVRIATPGGEVTITSALIGRHNALNLTAALGVLATLGVPWEDAARALGEAPAVRGRLEPVPDPEGRVILVDYAHTPDALEAVLATLREITSGRVHVVFGCGGGRDAGKRPLMGEVAARLADRVIVTSDNPRHEDPERILAEILAGIARPVEVEVDRATAIGRAIAGSAPGDVVLIAGKGHETTQQIGDRTTPFDDRDVAASFLRGGR